MKTLVIASALALSFGGAAAPAFAEPARTASSVAATTSAPGAAASVSKEQPAARRYCIVNKLTGSLLPIKRCRTRADWLKEGFDPLDPK